MRKSTTKGKFENGLLHDFTGKFLSKMGQFQNKGFAKRKRNLRDLINRFIQQVQFWTIYQLILPQMRSQNMGVHPEITGFYRMIRGFKRKKKFLNTIDQLV